MPHDRLIYVGDHYGDDVVGARAAGLDAVLVDRAGRFGNLPCPRVASLIDLPAYIQPPPAHRQAIIFDMDGVVLDSMPTHLRTWQQVMAPLGIHLTAADLYPLEGMPTAPTAQAFTERFLGQACSADEARRLAEAKRALFLEQFEPAFIPGIVPLLHDLRGRGYRLALVTGSSSLVVERMLAPAGMLPLFEHVTSSSHVDRGKPFPDPYLAAVSALGLEPGHCLAVENSPLGVRAARAAGLECAALETSLPAEHLSEADRVLPDVAALRAWLLDL